MARSNVSQSGTNRRLDNVIKIEINTGAEVWKTDYRPAISSPHLTKESTYLPYNITGIDEEKAQTKTKGGRKKNMMERV